MRKTNNTIEINGHRYDATTGEALTAAGHAAAAPVRPAARRHVPPAPKPAGHAIARHPAGHHHPHPPEASHTLMRHAVKKPGAGLKRHLRVQGHTDTLIKPMLDEAGLQSPAQRLDKQRLQHARHIAKSRLISHFSDAAVVRTGRPPARLTPVTPPHRPADGRRRQPRTTAELLDRAVQQARSHEELPPSKPRRGRARRHLAVGSAIVVAGLLVGLAVLQNLSNARLQLASAKAGFSAGLPSYRPDGYSLGQLKYGSGMVAEQFHNGGGQGYSLIQQRSSWDSSTLRDSFVAARAPGYQTVGVDGRTIYFYGQGNATWVNGGIWYIVQSDGSLTNQQIIDLALSL